MKQFVAGVGDTIKRRGMLKGGERVVVAVSGGPDSLALLFALTSLTPDLDLELHVAHFDHRLRDDSGADAVFVSRLARRLGLPVTIGSASATSGIRGRSPEEAARERRLAFLDDVADAAGADRIATGHTLDDQAETVLMRFLSGAGARGLAGIPPVRDRLIRPLIDRTRQETEAYCRFMRLRPRRDPTNDSTEFLRNALRRDVLPLLTSRVNRRLPQALARTADLLRDEDRLLDAMAIDAVDVEATPGGSRLSVEALLALPVALQRRVVRGMVGPPGLDAAHIERILGLAAGGNSGDSLDLPQRLNARLEYGSLLIGRATSPAKVSVVPLLVPGRTAVGWADAALVVWEEPLAPPAWPDGKSTCVIDADRLPEHPVVRTHRRGDRLDLLGMKGTKTVADVFSDEKVPRGRRTLVPIVAAGSDVVWVIGHRMAGRFKVTAETRRFLWLRFEGGTEWLS